ncbi:MAG TPA: ABC transporter substrate-binding protein [bacterium]|nr:ABC transporter substrate-binding protein [bacterium]
MAATLSRRRFLTTSAGAALSGLLEGTRTAVQAQGLTSLNIGLGFHNLDAAAAWIAQDKRFFEKFGLSVNILEFQGGAKSIVAIASGEVPISLNSGIEVINARSQGIPLQMIGGLVNKFSFDFVVAQNITSPSQLRGTKGAISSFGGSSDFAARYALTRLGINPQDVTLLPTGDETSRLQALQTGQIQFTVLTAGLDLVAFDLGYKPLIKLYTFDQPYQSSGIAVNAIWAKAHSAIVDALMKAIVTATVYMKNPLNVAAALALLHTHLPIKEGQLRQGFELYRDRFYSVYPFVTVPGMEFILRERKMTQPVTDFYDNSYVQALQNANFAATVAKSI